MTKPSVVMHIMTSPNGEEVYINPKLVRYITKGQTSDFKPCTILSYDSEDRVEVKQTPSQVMRIFGLLSPE